MSGLARWCYRHRIVVALLWIGVLVGLGALSRAAGSSYDNSFSLPGTGSSSAQQLLQQSFPGQAGDQDTVVWRVSTGTVRDGAVQARMSTALATIKKLPEVGTVTSPYGPRGATAISKDGRTAYATVTFTKQANDLAKDDIQRVIDTARAARTAGLDVELGGQAIEQTEQSAPSSSSAIGVGAAAIILFLAFGSLFAMLLPIVTALAGVAGGILLITPLSHAMSVVDFSPTLGALIGLGVGIDYALFIVTRHRRGLTSGLTPEDAAARAIDTSGRAVLFAGGTVCIALLGMFVLRVSFLNGLAVAAALTVVCTVLAAVTLLPALLGFLGMRVLSRRQRRRLRESGGVIEPHANGLWARWSRTVERRPAALVAAAAVVMVVLAIPLASFRLGSSDQGNDPSSTTTRQAYDLLGEGFGPGFNGPLLLVAQTGSGADKTALNRLVAQLPSVSGVASVAAPATAPDGTVELIQVTPTTSPEDKATSDLIRVLRNQVIPETTAGSTLHVYVGGQTATFDDFASVIDSKLPLFILAIVGLGFLLLVIAFRSLLVPATAAVMNLLGAAASFGVLTAFFEWGWGTDALGLGKAGPIEAFLPVMSLAILFGLSMDYQVFLVSRMNEEWVHTHKNGRSVRIGQIETARVITAAATIMISVFTAFVFGGQRVIAEFGISLAVAVALDAFVLRTVLVPALMHLFGSANWWLPSWLDRRLPHLAVEPPDETPATEPEPSLSPAP